eukprot:4366150-Karenia_brevis.AAC.1
MCIRDRPYTDGLLFHWGPVGIGLLIQIHSVVERNIGFCNLWSKVFTFAGSDGLSISAGSCVGASPLHGHACLVVGIAAEYLASLMLRCRAAVVSLFDLGICFRPGLANVASGEVAPLYDCLPCLAAGIFRHSGNSTAVGGSLFEAVDCEEWFAAPQVFHKIVNWQ